MSSPKIPSSSPETTKEPTPDIESQREYTNASRPKRKNLVISHKRYAQSLQKLATLISGEPRPIAQDDPIAYHSNRSPDAPAIYWRGIYSTFSQLHGRSNSLAAMLARHTHPNHGDMIGIFFSRNLPIFFEIAFASRRAGISFTNFNANLKPHDLVEQILKYNYKILFLDNHMLHSLSERLDVLQKKGVLVIDVSNRSSQAVPYAHVLRIQKRLPLQVSDSVAGIYRGPVMYTSGTTGPAKRISITHGKTVGESANKLFNIGENEIHLIVGKLYHGAALSWALGHLKKGAQVVLYDHPQNIFDPDLALSMVDKHGVTNMWLPPHWLRLMTESIERNPDKYNTQSLKNIYVGTAPFSPALKRRAIAALGPILWDNYATTEAGLITAQSPHEMSPYASSVGQAINGVEIEIRPIDSDSDSNDQIGHIFVKSPLTLGAFMATGDDGYIDAQGHLYILGRSIERIELGARILYPRVIESNLAEIPFIRECHVLWLNELSRLVIVISLEPNSEPDFQHIFTYIDSNFFLPKTLPASILVKSTIPRKPYKVDRHQLVAEVLQTINLDTPSRDVYQEKIMLPPEEMSFTNKMPRQQLLPLNTRRTGPRSLRHFLIKRSRLQSIK